LAEARYVEYAGVCRIDRVVIVLPLMSAYGLIKPLENESGDRVAIPVPFKMEKLPHTSAK
ncbi:MAG: hypothetical protein WBO75_07360, partial [Trichococcus flocculiformis]